MGRAGRRAPRAFVEAQVLDAASTDVVFCIVLLLAKNHEGPLFTIALEEHQEAPGAQPDKDGGHDESLEQERRIAGLLDRRLGRLLVPPGLAKLASPADQLAIKWISDRQVVQKTIRHHQQLPVASARAATDARLDLVQLSVGAVPPNGSSSGDELPEGRGDRRRVRRVHHLAIEIHALIDLVEHIRCDDRHVSTASALLALGARGH
mmetsp:Transcript_88688/g.271549  ORF Transcript_88688/g.271549 Transcript_88688/m.271549 type:complete len:207 (-) Transcript_88688:886-1506(-)